MPQYSYQCPNCGEVFEVIVSMARAMCERAYPNHKIAKCPNCGTFAPRLFPEPDFKIYVKIYDLDKIIRQIKPKPDPQLDGKIFMNAGYQYPTVDSSTINTSTGEVDNKEKNIELGFRDDIKCDCAFCSPELHRNLSGEQLRKIKDAELSELLKRNGNNLNIKRHSKDDQRGKIFQKALEATSNYIMIDNNKGVGK